MIKETEEMPVYRYHMITKLPNDLIDYLQKGKTGKAGPKGDKGNRGFSGLTGPVGPKGQHGHKGQVLCY